MEQVLWSVAEERAREHGYPFGGDSEQELHALIAVGARTMEEQGIAEDSPEMAEAIEHLREFVDEMAKEVEERGFDEFHEPTFARALGRFCPGLFPFC